MRHPIWRSAFSLIELLVVITIIVVLLALLAPAMDKAIYQAELTVCASHLHAIATGVTTYAFGHNRHYPYRAGPVDPDIGWQPSLLYNGDEVVGALGADGAYTGQKYDDRKLLRTFLAINSVLNDPLSGRIDLNQVTANSDRTHVYQPYALWFGWKYRGHRAMRKVGDRFTWTDDDTGGPISLDLLASDEDATNVVNAQSQSSHPDHDRIAANLVLQEENFWVAAYPMRTTASFWRTSGTPRSDIDLNFAHADGSVRRFNSIKVRDPKMRFVPHYSTNVGINGGGVKWRNTVPPP